MAKRKLKDLHPEDQLNALVTDPLADSIKAAYKAGFTKQDILVHVARGVFHAGAELPGPEEDDTFGWQLVGRLKNLCRYWLENPKYLANTCSHEQEKTT